MTELRKVRKVGASLTLTIPKDIGFCEKDWIKFEKVDDRVVLTIVEVQ